jgi:transcriptional regulator with XRE-family HTH domain
MDQAHLVARQIGARIRRARSSQKLTLQALGNATGLSAAYLSRVERGEAAASIANLILIATQLNIQLRDLFEDSNNTYLPKHYTISRRRQRETSPPLVAHGYDYHWLSGDLSEPKLSAFVLEFPVASDVDIKLLAHEGEEILYVLEGKIEFQIGEERFVLDPGDCVHLFGNKPHMGRNAGLGPARLLMVVTPSDVVEHRS